MRRQKRLQLDTPNVGVLVNLVTEAYENAHKPDALSHITKIEPWFSDAWGGIRILNQETQGEHFWVGIWWHQPLIIHFEFTAALYNPQQVARAQIPEEFDWWPYVRFKLGGNFLDKTYREQLDSLVHFITGVLVDLESAKVY